MSEKPDVRPEEFSAIDIRVGRILTVEPFPEARKPAWKIVVDFGAEIGVRQTSAQVTNYSIDELIGRLVVGAINLGSRRIAGFRSEFLLLGAVEQDKTVRLLELPSGTSLGSPVA